MVITHKTEQKQPKITSAMQRTLAAKLFWEKKNSVLISNH